MTESNLLKYNNLTGSKRRDKQLGLIGMCSNRTNTPLSPDDEAVSARTGYIVGALRGPTRQGEWL